MKQLVDSKAHRVLYAEAGKDIVDSHFSLLTLPVGTIVGLLTVDSMACSMGNLYGSIDQLDNTYVCRDDAKNGMLTPAGGWDTGKLVQLPELQHDVPAHISKNVLYRCNNNCRNYARVSGVLCTKCHHSMETPMHPLAESDGGLDGGTVPRAAGAGFVQGIVTCIVMDDLKVSPMSSISGITLNTFGVTDICSLQEKTMQLGYAEGLEILKASLQSKAVLTDVFLATKRSEGLK